MHNEVVRIREIKSCIPICIILHMGIAVCIWGSPRAGIAKKFAYGNPIVHNEIVHIQGLTYILCICPCIRK